MPKYIDLTCALEPGMRGVASDTARTLEDDGWNATNFHLYSHSGTHMDAPLHFGVTPQTLDQVPVDRFFVDAWLIDVSGIGDKGLILVKDLGEVANRIKEGEGLLFKTGWSRFIGQDKFRSQLPRISRELAQWCVDQKIGLVGVEPPSVADVENMEELTTIHTLLLGAGIHVITSYSIHYTK